MYCLLCAPYSIQFYIYYFRRSLGVVLATSVATLVRETRVGVAGRCSDSRTHAELRMDSGRFSAHIIY